MLRENMTSKFSKYTNMSNNNIEEEEKATSKMSVGLPKHKQKNELQRLF